METEPKSKRRWFQFSLRTLMILLAVAFVAYVTIALAGPPLVGGGQPDGSIRFPEPNPFWWFATLAELLAVNFWYARRERRD